MKRELDTLITQMHAAGITYSEAVRQFKKRYILEVLAHHKGNLGKAAEELAMHRNTLNRTLRELEMDPALAAGTIHDSPSQKTILDAIGEVADLCRTAPPDAAIAREMRQLESLKAAVQAEWPLPSSVKKQIDLGPYAAKNIADLNPALADALMHLDYTLQHNGGPSWQALRPIETSLIEAVPLRA